MTRPFALLSALAALQLALPAAAADPLMMLICGGGAPVPLPLQLPMKNKSAPDCKICHSAMRRRAGTLTALGEEEDLPDAA